MSSQIQIYMHGISVGDQLSIDRKKLTWDYNSSASILSLIIIENSHLSLNQSDAYLIQQCFTHLTLYTARSLCIFSILFFIHS